MTWSRATAIAGSAVVTLASCRMRIVRGHRERPRDGGMMAPGEELTCITCCARSRQASAARSWRAIWLDGRCFRFLHSRLRHRRHRGRIRHPESAGSPGTRQIWVRELAELSELPRNRCPGILRNPIRWDWVIFCDCRLCVFKQTQEPHAGNWPSFTLPLLCRQPVWRRLNRLESRLLLANVMVRSPLCGPHKEHQNGATVI